MTRASDTAKLLGAGATILDGTTISTADNTDQLTLLSTDADANVGPNLNLYRNSGSPADNDVLGLIIYNGRNDNSQDVIYARQLSYIKDASDGTEDGQLTLQTMVAGTIRDRLNINPTEIVLNEDSQDLDFRVESNGNANMLFVEGETDRVAIGHNDPSQLLDVRGTGAVGVGIGSTNAGGVSLILDGDSNGDFIGSDYCNIQHDTSGRLNIIQDSPSGTNQIRLFTEGTTERMRISSNILIGTTDNSPAEGTGAGTRIGTNGGCQFSTSGIETARMNRTGDGNILVFAESGSVEGAIAVSGTTVSLNGGHLSRWSRLLDNSKDTSIVKGTVMTNLDEMIEWKHEKELWTKNDELPDGVSIGDVKKDAYTEDNEQLNNMAVSSVEGDVNVAGVFVNWDNDDDYNDMNVAMTGDMVIRIAKDTTVARGGLLMSAGDGTAKPQDDDIVRSKTIAKVTSINKSHTYDDGTYLVPCVLMAC